MLKVNCSSRIKEKGRLNVKGESSDCETSLYDFPRSSETIGSDSFENPGKISTFFFTFFYFFTSAIKHSCYETNFKARKVYPLFMMLDFGSFLLFLSVLRAFMTLKY